MLGEEINGNRWKVPMMVIDKYDWQFNIDFQKTKSLYLGRMKSLLDAKIQPPELVDFLNELGIDIEKPDKSNPDFSDVLYTCIGTAESDTPYEIDIYGDEQYIAIVVYIKRDTVLLEVFGMKSY